MNPGHGDCWRGNLNERGFSRGGIMPHTPQCDRKHLETIQTDDGTGTGPLVAYYCRCCGEIIRKAEYV